MYLLFEGIDTSGKSTQIELLTKVFKDVILTKEPGGTTFGLKAREILLEDSLHSKRAELLLFLADRAEHYHQIIKKNRDKLIVSDRGFLSGIAYALANGDFEFNHLVELNKFALEEDFPDLIILFLTNMETLTQRMGEKKLDGIELRGLEYLISVQNHMQKSLEKLAIPHLLIDATDSIDNIHKIISDTIHSKRLFS
ncbi:MAG: Thymidylate kinase (EC [uncultured Sulfurovum sp.]|uniref:Thymidylate kinase n=1 Tax=uncultured Sulfurovum sp. TaxID=269237 RepID=A0A6S6TIT4_9BACT|nr:MAG: Thymidylate kinase (EC [uncultured Sulfurovum sp.]